MWIVVSGVGVVTIYTVVMVWYRVMYGRVDVVC